MCDQSFVSFCNIKLINPFVANAPFLYPPQKKKKIQVMLSETRLY